MAVIWTRIDEKLIHGQVVVAWVPYLRIDTIIIADLDINDDVWTQTVMRLGLPPEVQTAIFTSPDGLGEIVKDEGLVLRRVMILFRNISALIAAVESGFQTQVVNLGNHACQSPKEDRRLSNTFYATGQELAELTSIHKKGSEVILQAVPTEKAIHWNPV